MQYQSPLNTLHSGYVGSPEAWVYFFNQLLKSEYVDEQMEARGKDKWLENKEILRNNIFIQQVDFSLIEKELNRTLPQSFKDFVKANGITFYNQGLAHSVWDGLSQVNAINYCKDDVESDYFLNFIATLCGESPENTREDFYYTYNDYQKYIGLFNAVNHPDNYDNEMYGELGGYFLADREDIYKNAIGLDQCDPHNIYLMPDELTKDNEMECWFIGTSADTFRYRSFAEMIISEIFRGHDIPDNMTLVEYLKYHGVDHILDFDILKRDAYIK